jgi:3-oxoadipate enol-lactonase
VTDALQPRGLAVERHGRELAGESLGEGPPIVLLHGLTATRRHIVHGSKVLARRGHHQLSYDARGHGDSDPAPEGEGYSYPEMVADLDAVLDRVGERRPVLAGHSMGAHTAVAYALTRAERLAGMVLISPSYTGQLDEETLEDWDRLAEALEDGGADGFMAAYERRGLDPAWRDTVVRFTRQRMLAHRHLDAVARALREVPRSAPFESLSELEFCDLPALVVATHDDADPGHPYAVAAAYAQRLPRSRLVSEDEGEPPLAWRGGKLSREIATFCAEPAVARRFA